MSLHVHVCRKQRAKLKESKLHNVHRQDETLKSISGRVCSRYLPESRHFILAKQNAGWDFSCRNLNIAKKKKKKSLDSVHIECSVQNQKIAGIKTIRVAMDSFQQLHISILFGLTEYICRLCDYKWIYYINFLFN